MYIKTHLIFLTTVLNDSHFHPPPTINTGNYPHITLVTMALLEYTQEINLSKIHNFTFQGGMRFGMGSVYSRGCSSRGEECDIHARRDTGRIVAFTDYRTWVLDSWMLQN